MFNVKHWSVALTQLALLGYNEYRDEGELPMKAGLVADIIVALFIIVITAICAKRGFIRSILRMTSTFLALLIAFFAASPLANLLDRKFDLLTKVADWHVPFLTANTLLCLLVGAGIFIVARLLFIILDKLLQFVKEKIKVVNVTDRVLGVVFGLVLSTIYLTIIFMLADSLKLTTVLQLTPESGGYVAPYLFKFFKAHIFPIVGVIFNAVSATLPKI